MIRLSRSALVAVTVIIFSSGAALADDDDDYDYDHDDEAQAFIHGAPSNPSDVWVLSAGGRIYDNWSEALDRDKPERTHPSYPTTGSQEGETTWRCKECHGWDYRGVDGVYRAGSHYTGIKGINGAIGMDESAIAAILRSPLHGYTPEMITDDELNRVAAFVSRGQIEMSAYIDLATREVIAGDIENGRGIFQTVCAACHGFDGRRLDWGDADGPAYIGTEAAAAPDEVMNKILNAHPGVEMVNLRAFGVEAAGDVLRYVTTLPQD